jgi:hypothetical protein
MVQSTDAIALPSPSPHQDPTTADCPHGRPRAHPPGLSRPTHR